MTPEVIFTLSSHKYEVKDSTQITKKCSTFPLSYKNVISKCSLKRPVFKNVLKNCFSWLCEHYIYICMGQNTMCTFPFNINIMQNNIFAAARFFQYLRSLPLKQEVFLSAASHIKGLNRSRSSVRDHLNASRRDV